MPTFKVGDTIKVVSRLYEDDGTAFPLNDLTVRSILKLGNVEVVGSNSLLDNFTLQTVFITADLQAGQYQTDIRFTGDNDQSFSTPTEVVTLQPRVS